MDDSLDSMITMMSSEHLSLRSSSEVCRNHRGCYPEDNSDVTGLALISYVLPTSVDTCEPLNKESVT